MGLLKVVAKFTGKHLCQSFFLNFATFLRTSFFTDQLWSLLLVIAVCQVYFKNPRYDARCLKLVRRAQRARKQSWGTGGRSKPSSGGVRRRSPLRTFLGVLDALSQLIITRKPINSFYEANFENFLSRLHDTNLSEINAKSSQRILS